MTTELIDRPWRRRSAPTRCVGFAQIEEWIRGAEEAMAGYDCANEGPGGGGYDLLKSEFSKDSRDNLRRSFNALGGELGRLTADCAIDGPTLRDLSRRVGSLGPDKLKLAQQAADQILALFRQWEAARALLEDLL